jgi:hypothetical protein
MERQLLPLLLRLMASVAVLPLALAKLYHGLNHMVLTWTRRSKRGVQLSLGFTA